MRKQCLLVGGGVADSFRVLVSYSILGFVFIDGPNRHIYIYSPLLTHDNIDGEPGDEVQSTHLPTKSFIEFLQPLER